jgi:hypothetical protein
LRVLKNPIYRELPRFQVDGAIAHLANRTRQQMHHRALQEATQY